MRPTNFLLCLAAILLSQPLFAQWQPLPGPEGGNVTCRSAAPNGTLYAGGAAGLFTSTDDGKNWHILPGSAALGQLPIQLKWDNGNLYMVGQNYTSNTRVLWKSSDNGANWTNIRENVWEVISSMTVFDARNDTVVVSTSGIGSTSIDGGTTWRDSPTDAEWNIIGTKQGWFDNFYSTAYQWTGDWAWTPTYMGADLTTHPRRILEAGDFVFIFFQGPDTRFKYREVGDTSWSNGILPIEYSESEVSVAERNDTIFMQGGNAFAFSTDGLQTWHILTVSNLTGPVKDCFFTPSGAMVAFTNRGIFRAAYPGAAFLPAKGFNSQNTTAVLSEDDGAWWSGTDTGLYYSADNGASWTKQLTQLANGNTAIRWIIRRGNDVIAGNNEHFFYSPNHGDNWIERTLPGTPSTSIYDFTRIGERVFYADFANTWYSDDWGATWHSFSPASSGTPIFSRVFAETDSLLAVAAQWSEVYLSRDTGATWQDFSAGLGGIPYVSLDMAIGPQHLYIVSGYRMMRSPLSGPAWEQVTLPLPLASADGPVPKAFHFSGNNILAGIPGAGIYRSEDESLSWSSYAPTALYNLTNGYFFTDSLSVLATKGGIWYKGTIGSELVGGRVYVDANQNAQFDSTETPLSGRLVKMKDQQVFVATDARGRYAFDWQGVSDSLILNDLSINPGNTPPAHYANAPGINYDFPIAYSGINTDLALDITSSAPPRPGFAFNVFLTIRNEGLLPTDAHLWFSKDLATTWQGFSETPLALGADTAQWFFNAIPPGSFVRVQVTLKLDAATPIAALLHFSGKTIPGNALDLHGDNNVQLYILQVVGSLDPNDKSVFPSGNIPPAMVADTQQLVYTIRFQNTGNYPAEFVRITDALSPALDLGSLRILASSHPMEWSLNGRLLECYFPNIQLADSTSDEPGSHGFVKYSIAMRPDLKLYDVVANYADIFFDFNTPVRTNTIQTEVNEISSGTAAAPTQLDCRISPNPVQDVLDVFWGNEGESLLQVFDLQGKLLISTKAETPAKIRVGALEPGAYQLLIRSGDRIGQAVFVKLK